MNITNIVAGVISLAFLIVSFVLIPFIREKVGEAKFEKMKKWAQVGVEAAEMIFKGSGLGAQKKAYVLSFLEEKGFKIDAEAIDALIESCVLEMKNAAK